MHLLIGWHVCKMIFSVKSVRYFYCAITQLKMLECYCPLPECIWLSTVKKTCFYFCCVFNAWSWWVFFLGGTRHTKAWQLARPTCQPIALLHLSDENDCVYNSRAHTPVQLQTFCVFSHRWSHSYWLVEHMQQLCKPFAAAQWISCSLCIYQKGDKKKKKGK